MLSLTRVSLRQDYKIYMITGFTTVRGGRRLMKFEYTGRHVEVSPAIRRHVEDHFKKLDHIFNGDSTLSTHVIIDVEKNRQIGEIICTWPSRGPWRRLKSRRSNSRRRLSTVVRAADRRVALRRNLMETSKPRRARRASFRRAAMQLNQ